MSSTITSTSTDVLASSKALLDAHDALLRKLEANQQRYQSTIQRFPSPPPGLGTRFLVPARSPHNREGSVESSDSETDVREPLRADLPPIKRLRAARYKNYSPEEETIRNDYSQQYVDGGDWPQNFVQGAEPGRRFEEYPKQQRLLNLKKQAVAHTAHCPCYLPMSELQTLSPSKFDVILVDPPFSSTFTWDTLANLPVPTLAADPSFVFLWVGSGAGDGLERGREILYRWGYRRCEDVVWIKTNKETNLGPGSDHPTSSLFARTKQHCLIGIRGTVRRSTDSWFVHCNVDTDVMFWEGDPTDPTRKPPEMYTLVENFCLGLRRLELFGRSHSLRPGWVTVGDIEDSDIDPSINAVEWDRGWWDAHITSFADASGRHVVPTTQDIEMLRPKSPVPRNAQLNASRLGPSGGSLQNQGSGMLHNRPPTFGSMVGGNNNALQMQAAMSMPIHMQHMQMQMSGGNQGFSQGHFPNQSPFMPLGPHFQHQQLPQQPQQHTITQTQTSQPLNAFAAPFVPASMDPNVAAAAMMGFGDPSMVGGVGVNGMRMNMASGMGMGLMQQLSNQMPAQMHLQMMQPHEGMQTPFLVDPSSMMQQQIQLGLAGVPTVPSMPGMGMGAMGIGMNIGMNMGVSAADVGRGSGMDIPGMQMSPLPLNQFGTHHHQMPQFQPTFNATGGGSGGGGLRGGASGPNPSLSRAGVSGGTGVGFGAAARDILSATPMRQLQPPTRQPNSGGGGARG